MNRAVNQLPLVVGTDDTDVLHLVRVVGGTPEDRKIARSLVSAEIQTSGSILSNAQILDLYDTPVEITLAAAPGKVIVPEQVFIAEVGATVSFGGPTLVVGSTSTLSDTVYNMVAGGPEAPPSDKVIMYPYTSATRAPIVAGDSLSIKALGSNPTGGDGEYSITILYKILDA